MRGVVGQLQNQLPAAPGPGFVRSPDVGVHVRDRIIGEAVARSDDGLLKRDCWTGEITGNRGRSGVAGREYVQPLEAAQAEFHRD